MKVGSTIGGRGKSEKPKQLLAEKSIDVLNQRILEGRGEERVLLFGMELERTKCGTTTNRKNVDKDKS